jgi:hypothetical protein
MQPSLAILAGRLLDEKRKIRRVIALGVKLARETAWRSPADLFNSRGGKGPVLDGPLT